MAVLQSHPPFTFDQGGVAIASTDQVFGRFRAIQALTVCTLAAGTTSANLAGPLEGLTIPAGTTVSGTFTAIQLASGSAVAYY